MSTPPTTTRLSPHGVPPPDMCCLCTLDPITPSSLNYCEYQTYPSLKWSPSLYDSDTIDHLRRTQYKDYVERVRKTDCQAELKRLLSKGPPVYISDPTALPLPPGDTHISRLWFAKKPEVECSAKLEGAKEGEDSVELARRMVGLVRGANARLVDIIDRVQEGRRRRLRLAAHLMRQLEEMAEGGDED